MEILKKVEAARGCGYRKKKGYYLVSSGLAGHCGKLPIELTICPCCGAGIKQGRAFQWINSSLFANAPCQKDGKCGVCPLSEPNEKMGLLWVGEKFYKTPDDFLKEANSRGVSKRIGTIPRELELGKTWIALAHPKGIARVVDGEISHFPAVFHAFIPERIEYVVAGDETEDELQSIVKRGVTLVDVTPDIEMQGDLFEEED